MFRSIVVPLDLTETGDRALPVARALAQRAGLDVELFCVSSVGLDPLADRLALQRRADTFEGLRCATTVLHEREAAHAVIGAVADRKDALLCMATHARTVPGAFVFGSVSEEVVRRASCPMLLVGPHVAVDPPPALTSLVVCLDGSREAEQLVPVADDWVATFGSTPWVFQAVEPAHYDPERGWTTNAVESGYVHRMATRLSRPGVSAEWDVGHAAHANRPADSILRFAETLAGPVIAFTTHGRSGLSRAVLGSVALDVTRRAPVPVLVVRTVAVAGTQRDGHRAEVLAG